MPIFQAVRRYKKWAVRLPLHDGRECPDCGALIIGDKGQDGHRAYHEAIRDWQEWAEEVIRTVAAQAGMTIWKDSDTGGEASGLDIRDDELHDAKRRRVPWQVLMTDEDDDERLTRKARRVIAGGEDDDDGTD